MDKEHPKNPKLQAETVPIYKLSFLSSSLSTDPHLDVGKMDKKWDICLLGGPSAQSLKRLFLV